MIFSFRKLFFSTLTLVVIIGYSVFVVSAAAPLGGYDPGETLDPDCAPNDVDCLVTLPSGGATPTNGLSVIGSDIGLGGSLTGNTTIDVDGNDFTVSSGNSFLEVSADFMGLGVRGAGFGYQSAQETAYILIPDMDDTPSGYPAIAYTYDNLAGYTTERELLFGDTAVSLKNEETIIGDFSARSQLILDGNNLSLTQTDLETNAYTELTIDQNLKFNVTGSFVTDTVSKISLSDHFSGVINGALLTHTNTADSDSAFVYAADVAGSTQSGMTYIGSTGFAYSFAANSTGAYLSYTDFTNIETKKQIAVDMNGFIYQFDAADLMGGFYRFPNSQGNASQVLTTDGAGNLYWGSSLGLSPISVGPDGALYSSGLAGTEQDGIANIFLGLNAGSGAVVSNSNFLGWDAGSGATNAAASNFFGVTAGKFAVDAVGSNFFGESAGFGAANASGSNFLGYQSGYLAPDASNSNFLGAGAGYGANGAAGSNFFGFEAGLEADLAIHANFFGANAGLEASGAEYSNFLGNEAGYQAFGASNANFFGYQAGYQAESSSNSNFIGQYAGNLATNASGSNFIGTQAGEAATNAYNSTFIGANAGSNAVDANGAIFIGNNAGNSDIVNNTGNADDFSILIGPNTSTGNDGLGVGYSNSIALGAYATNTASNQFMIGSATRPIDEVVIVGNGASCAIDNNIYGDGTTGINCSSDERLKTNITEIGSVLETLGNVQAVNFNWKANPDGNINIGFIAQNLEQYYPELVRTGHDGYLQVNYAGITPILVKAIQELNLKIDTLQLATPGSETPAPLFAAVSDWLGDTANGIIEIIADTVRARNQLCIDDVCMTKDQLRTLLENNGMETENESEDTSSSTPDDETIPEESSDESGIEPVESEPTETISEPESPEPTPEPETEIITEPAPTESGDSGVPA